MSTSVFFPDRFAPLGPAKQVCATCPVRAACLEDGLHEKFGIFGGLSERERRRVRRQRRQVGGPNESLRLRIDVCASGATPSPVDIAPCITGS